MAVYLCTMINHEVDLLRVKLEEAWEFVDRFYVVESSYTFTGSPKPLHLKEHWNKIKDFEEKIEYVLINETLDDPLANEAQQRNKALPAQLADDDILFCCDVDEIEIACQYSSLIELAKQAGVFRMHKRCFYYNVNLLSNEILSWSFVARGDFVKSAPDLTTIRNAQDFPGMLTLGGHFTYLMTPEQIADKIHSSTHTEFDRAEFTDQQLIERRIAELRDPFDRECEIKPVAIDATFPAAFSRPEWRDWVHQPEIYCP